MQFNEDINSEFVSKKMKSVDYEIKSQNFNSQAIDKLSDISLIKTKGSPGVEAQVNEQNVYDEEDYDSR